MYDARNEPREFVGSSRSEAVAKACAHFGADEGALRISAPEALFTIPGIDLPVRVLPLVMGLSMVLQAKLTPQPTADPAQARMMATLMPVLFTVMFYTFPSGLVLYWFVSNLLAVGQQWWMVRGQPTPEPAPVAAPRPRGKG